MRLHVRPRKRSVSLIHWFKVSIIFQQTFSDGKNDRVRICSIFLIIDSLPDSYASDFFFSLLCVFCNIFLPNKLQFQASMGFASLNIVCSILLECLAFCYRYCTIFLFAINIYQYHLSLSTLDIFSILTPVVDYAPIINVNCCTENSSFQTRTV